MTRLSFGGTPPDFDTSLLPSDVSHCFEFLLPFLNKGAYVLRISLTHSFKWCLLITCIQRNRLGLCWSQHWQLSCGQTFKWLHHAYQLAWGWSFLWTALSLPTSTLSLSSGLLESASCLVSLSSAISETIEKGTWVEWQALCIHRNVYL